MQIRRTRPLVVLIVGALSLFVATAGAAGAGGKDTKKTEKLSLGEAEANVLENTREFVGTVEGTDAYISVVEFEGDVEIYICDGAELIAWPTGTVALPDGSEHAFTAAPAVNPAGLYRRAPSVDAAGTSVRAATIVLPDGSSRGGSAPASAAFCKAAARAAIGFASQLTYESDGNGGTVTTGPIGAADKAAHYAGLFFNNGCLKTVGALLTS